jgi:hypothetical protein
VHVSANSVTAGTPYVPQVDCAPMEGSTSMVPTWASPRHVLCNGVQLLRRECWTLQEGIKAMNCAVLAPLTLLPQQSSNEAQELGEQRGKAFSETTRYLDYDSFNCIHANCVSWCISNAVRTETFVRDTCRSRASSKRMKMCAVMSAVVAFPGDRTSLPAQTFLEALVQG